MAEIILSTGIDIGTTTTHLIVSKLTLEVTQGFGSAPRADIVEKEIVYESQIYFTPLINNEVISAKGVKEIIDSEYKKANITPQMLQSGAVIITGESARRRNAKELLYEISAYAGDFIVAEAGGSTESVLAGKGVYADKISENEQKMVCTADIGGGTANMAVFSDGRVIETACINVGGRLVTVNGDGVITNISKYLRPLLDENGIKISVGNVLTPPLSNAVTTALLNRLIKEFQSLPQADEYIFSGGVSASMCGEYAPFQFGDIGVLLGEKIKNSEWFKTHNCKVADNSIRATVIGAGNYSFELSGSTISHFNCELPIKNIPAIDLKISKEADILKAFENLKARVEKFSTKTVAFCFTGFNEITADNMMLIAENIAKSAEGLIEKNAPIIVLIEQDIGKAFGICLKRFLPPNYPLLCADCIHAGDGDYIDIGQSVGGGRAVLVSVKQIVFS